MIDYKIIEQIYQGAEAKLYIVKLEDNTKAILKERVSKSYRIESLDKKIIEERTKKELKMYKKLEDAKINAPKAIDYDIKTGKILMTYFNLPSLKNTITKHHTKIELLAKEVAKLHLSDISHGDITLENVLYNKDEDKVILIDFGLSQVTKRAEDYATDIYVFKETLLAEFDKKVWNIFLEKYKECIGLQKPQIFERLSMIEKRRRYAN